jgi:hypothetical protein
MAERLRSSRLTVPQERGMGSQFPKLFRETYAIHAIIDQMVRQGLRLDRDEIERRIREEHPEMDIPPESLANAITEAIADTPEHG